MSKKRRPHLSALVIGYGFARVQHGIDKAVEWGMRRMKDVDHEAEIVPEKKPSTLGRLGLAVRKSIGFLGDAGDAYYRTYEKLKQKNRSSGHS